MAPSRPSRSRSPPTCRAQAEAWRERLMDHVAEASDDLMERYLEGAPIADDELVAAFKDLVVRGELFPVACGAATRNVGTRALLDLIVDGLPSPARAERMHAHDRSGDDIVLELEGGGVAASASRRSPTPTSASSACSACSPGASAPTRRSSTSAPTTRSASARSSRSRVGTTGPSPTSARATSAPSRTEGRPHGRRAGRHRSRPCDRSRPAADARRIGRRRASNEGGRREDGTGVPAARRGGPTLRLSRDDRTGQLIVSGLSQMHVEVVVERLKRRFGVEVVTHPPRVPYLEAIRRKARAQGRYKKQTGGRGQFGDCHIEIEPLPGTRATSSSTGSSAGSSRHVPARGRCGVQETMATGELAGYPSSASR